jgi:hypothetical protein
MALRRVYLKRKSSNCVPYGMNMSHLNWLLGLGKPLLPWNYMGVVAKERQLVGCR